MTTPRASPAAPPDPGSDDVLVTARPIALKSAAGRGRTRLVLRRPDSYLREWIAYGGTTYDWREAEAAINAYEHTR